MELRLTIQNLPILHELSHATAEADGGEVPATHEPNAAAEADSGGGKTMNDVLRETVDLLHSIEHPRIPKATWNGSYSG